MSGKAIGISMNHGYPGTYARTPDDIVASRKLKGDATVPFGAPVVLNSDNTYSPVGASTTGAEIAGIALRIVKQASAYDNQNVSQYKPGEMMSVIERGAVVVQCNVGTPTAGGKVYVRIAENEEVEGGVVGGFEASADTTKTIEVPNMCWTNGYLDANRVAEVTILTRQKP